ncbi:MAG: hypothetical protein GY812_17440 [Actinomycetia bacterium]|nr:hypothetical protein [Actinomycetes bacterium]
MNESDLPHDDSEPGQPGIPVEWAVDTAIGAVSAAGRAATAVSRSAPGRLFTAAARLVSAPLTQEGQEVREKAGPAATEVLSTVTPEVVGAINLDDVLAAIDINALLADVDIAAIISKVDVDELVSGVDVQGIVDRVDIDGIVDRVDIDRIVARVDLDALMQRIDIDALLDRIDLNALVSRIDVDKLIQETEIGSIIAASTTGVASEALDAVRRQGVSLDNVVARVSARIVRKDPDELPAGPPLLVDDPKALPVGADHGGES